MLYCVLAWTLAGVACKDSAGDDAGSEDKAGILKKPPYQAVTDSIREISGENQPAATLAALYFRRAELLARNNQHELAVADYRKSWDLRPDENTGLRYAATLSIVGRPAEAERLLEDCHRRYPTNTEFAAMLGDLYQQTGKIRHALSIYDDVLGKDSSNFEAWYEKALLLEKVRDTTAAIQALQHAMALQPVNTYALELAHLYAETGNPKALTLADQVLAHDPNHELVDPFFIKGIFYSNTKDYGNALVQYDSCIRRDWKFTDAYLEKGIVLYHQHKYQEALGIFKLSIQVSNTYADGYYWAGRCYEAMGQNEEALTCYQQTLGLDKDFSEAAEAIKRIQSHH